MWMEITMFYYMDLISLFTTFILVSLVKHIKGGGYSLWLCGYSDGTDWKWDCGYRRGGSLSSTYENWVQASAPLGAIGEGVAMEDTHQFKFESYSQSTKLPRLMCEADLSFSTSCSAGWGHIVWGQDSCWQLRWRPEGYTWQESKSECESTDMLGSTAYLCVVETHEEYIAIRDWLGPLVPTSPQTSASTTTAIPSTITTAKVIDFASSTVHIDSTTDAAPAQSTSISTLHTTPQIASTVTLENVQTVSKNKWKFPVINTARYTYSSSLRTKTPQTRFSYTSTPVMDTAKITTPSLEHTSIRTVSASTDKYLYVNTTRTRTMFILNKYIVPATREDYIKDNRLFAVGVGILSIVLMVLFMTCICLLDIRQFIRDFKRMRKNIRHFLKNVRNLRGKVNIQQKYM